MISKRGNFFVLGMSENTKGVHLSQVHQQRKVHQCYVSGLIALLVHFLLWQAAKPSGDKCTT